MAAGYSGYYRLYVHVDQGVTPPSLTSLGIPYPSGGRIDVGNDTAATQPICKFVSPLDGTTVCGPNVDLVAYAVKLDGNITRVKFYNGNNWIGTAVAQGNAIYRWTWPNVPPGTYTLKAIATDDTGHVGTSENVTVTVQGPNTDFNSGEDAGNTMSTAKTLLPYGILGYGHVDKCDLEDWWKEDGSYSPVGRIQVGSASGLPSDALQVHLYNSSGLDITTSCTTYGGNPVAQGVNYMIEFTLPDPEAIYYLQVKDLSGTAVPYSIYLYPGAN
jgi:hypothetical protein